MLTKVVLACPKTLAGLLLSVSESSFLQQIGFGFSVFEERRMPDQNHMICAGATSLFRIASFKDS
jgi:hypothetical protein